jgi:Rrf2 family nitric oxide-sensitive transcriptional repressor
LNRLNRKVEYALMALKVMAHKRAGELTSAKEIVEVTGCPFDATARVLQQMAQKEILRSEQGAHGGYVLIRDLSKISVFDLMQVILGPIAVARCLTDESACDLKAKCNIVSPVATFNRRLTEFYQNLSIGEILRIKDAPADLEAAR